MEDNLPEAIQYIPQSKQSFIEELRKMGNITLYPNVVNGCMFIEKKNPDTVSIWTLKQAGFWYHQKALFNFNLTRFTKKESFDPYKYCVNITTPLLFSVN